MSRPGPWRLAPLWRLRAHQAKAAAQALGAALRAEAGAAESAGMARCAAQEAGRRSGGASLELSAALLRGGAAWAGRLATEAVRAEEEAAAAAAVTAAERECHLEARADEGVMELLGRRWSEAERRRRGRVEEAALDELGGARRRAPWSGVGVAGR